MTRTLTDMTPEERADCVGRWCEDQEGDLVILVHVDEPRADGTVAVDVLHPPSRDRLHYLAPELSPRFDLPRAWTPPGEPVDGEWEEKIYQDGIGDYIRFTRQRRYITDWEVPHDPR